MTDEQFLHTRHSDGLFNDLEAPKMGCVGMRFGRNVPRQYTHKPPLNELMTPNPRLISEQLLKRDVFKPATTLNLLAAAWIQFQVHDWFRKCRRTKSSKSASNADIIPILEHENSPTETYDIDLPPGDIWHSEGDKMRVEKTQPETLDSTDEVAPAYKNKNTHWWDGSQIYGSTEARTTELRQDARNGKLLLDAQCFLPRDENGIPATGFSEN